MSSKKSPCSVDGTLMPAWLASTVTVTESAATAFNAVAHKKLKLIATAVMRHFFSLFIVLYCFFLLRDSIELRRRHLNESVGARRQLQRHLRTRFGSFKFSRRDERRFFKGIERFEIASGQNFTSQHARWGGI